METAFANINIKTLATVQPEQPPRQSAVTIALQRLADTNTAQLSNVDALILTAAKNATIGEMQPTEIAAAVNQCFKFIAIDVGYKRPADDAEWQYIVVRLADVLKRHFYDLTIEDVKTAFELLTVGDLDNYLPINSNGEPDRSHYQNLTTSRQRSRNRKRHCHQRRPKRPPKRRGNVLTLTRQPANLFSKFRLTM